MYKIFSFHLDKKAKILFFKSQLVELISIVEKLIQIKSDIYLGDLQKVKKDLGFIYSIKHYINNIYQVFGNDTKKSIIPFLNAIFYLDSYSEKLLDLVNKNLDEKTAQKFKILIQNIKDIQWGWKLSDFSRNRRIFEPMGRVRVSETGKIYATDGFGRKITLRTGDLLGRIKPKHSKSIISETIKIGQLFLSQFGEASFGGNPNITHINIVKELDSKNRPIVADATALGVIVSPLEYSKGIDFVLFRPKSKYIDNISRILKAVTPKQLVEAEVQVHDVFSGIKLDDEQKSKIGYNFLDYLSIPLKSSLIQKQSLSRMFKLLQYYYLDSLEKDKEGIDRKYVCSNFCLSILQSASVAYAYEQILKDKTISNEIKKILKPPFNKNNYKKGKSDIQIHNWAKAVANTDAGKVLLDRLPAEMFLQKSVSPMTLINIFEKLNVSN